MAASGYNTNLASEFYALSVLYRLGFDANLTLGNKKSVDIVVVLEEGRSVTVDVKANRGKNDWLLGDSELQAPSNHFVVLLSYEGQFDTIDFSPRAWIFPARELLPFVKVAGNLKTRFVPRKLILESGKDFADGWALLSK